MMLPRASARPPRRAASALLVPRRARPLSAEPPCAPPRGPPRPWRRARRPEGGRVGGRGAAGGGGAAARPRRRRRAAGAAASAGLARFLAAASAFLTLPTDKSLKASFFVTDLWRRVATPWRPPRPAHLINSRASPVLVAAARGPRHNSRRRRSPPREHAGASWPTSPAFAASAATPSTDSPSLFLAASRKSSIFFGGIGAPRVGPLNYLWMLSRLLNGWRSPGSLGYQRQLSGSHRPENAQPWLPASHVLERRFGPLASVSAASCRAG